MKVTIEAEVEFIGEFRAPTNAMGVCRVLHNELEGSRYDMAMYDGMMSFKNVQVSAGVVQEEKCQ